MSSICLAVQFSERKAVESRFKAAKGGGFKGRIGEGFRGELEQERRQGGVIHREIQSDEGCAEAGASNVGGLAVEFWR